MRNGLVLKPWLLFLAVLFGSPMAAWGLFDFQAGFNFQSEESIHHSSGHHGGHSVWPGYSHTLAPAPSLHPTGGSYWPGYSGTLGHQSHLLLSSHSTSHLVGGYQDSSQILNATLISWALSRQNESTYRPRRRRHRSRRSSRGYERRRSSFSNYGYGHGLTAQRESSRSLSISAGSTEDGGFQLGVDASREESASLRAGHGHGTVAHSVERSGSVALSVGSNGTEETETGTGEVSAEDAQAYVDAYEAGTTPAAFAPPDNPVGIGRIESNAFMELLQGQGFLQEEQFMCEQSNVNRCEGVSSDLADINPEAFRSMSDSQAKDAFVEWLRPAAQYWGMLTGVPPSLIIAQAAIESDYGRSRRFRQDMNLFSIGCGTIGDIQTSVGSIEVDDMDCNGRPEPGHTNTITTADNYNHALRYYLGYLTSRMDRLYPRLSAEVAAAKERGPLEIADMNELMRIDGYETVNCGGQSVRRPIYALTVYACDPRYRNALVMIHNDYPHLNHIECRECLNESIRQLQDGGGSSTPTTLAEEDGVIEDGTGAEDEAI